MLTFVRTCDTCALRHFWGGVGDVDVREKGNRLHQEKNQKQNGPDSHRWSGFNVEAV